MNRTEPMPADADVRETPPELFAELNARYSFTLDAAATHANAKCALYCTEHGFFERMGTPENPLRPYAVRDNHVDGLTKDWSGLRVWVNPPYSDIAPWVLKAWESKAELVYMLVPATRTEQGWFQDLIEPFRDGRVDFPGSDLQLTTHFLRGRTRFLKDGKRMGSPKFGCVGLLWQL
jgi:hypothetical protein